MEGTHGVWRGSPLHPGASRALSTLASRIAHGSLELFVQFNSSMGWILLPEGLHHVVFAVSCPGAAMQVGRTYGGLADEDRIFQNLYGEHGWRLKDAMKRVRLEGGGERDPGDFILSSHLPTICFAPGSMV